MGREGAGEAVRASQEVHRESLLQECSGLRLQVGEGAVREIQLKAELEVQMILAKHSLTLIFDLTMASLT